MGVGIAGIERRGHERTYRTCRAKTDLSCSFTLRNDSVDKEWIRCALKQTNDNNILVARLRPIGKTTCTQRMRKLLNKTKEYVNLIVSGFLLLILHLIITKQGNDIYNKSSLNGRDIIYKLYEHSINYILKHCKLCV